MPPPAGAPGAVAPMAAMGYSTSIVPACSNLRIARRGLALFQRMLEVDEHHVHTGRLERDRLAWLDFEAALDGPHLHHAIVHGHGVYLTLGAGLTGHAGHPIRRLTVIRDGHVSSARRCALWRRAGPGLGDVDRADIVVGRFSRRCSELRQSERESRR